MKNVKTYSKEELETILFIYADEQGLLSSKEDIENFNEFIVNNI